MFLSSSGISNLFPDGSDPRRTVVGVVIGFVIALLICSLMGCKTVKYVPVTETKTDTLIVNNHDTIVRERVMMDSVWVHDSIFESIFMKGDTVWQTKYVEHTQYKDRLKHDSIYLTKTDTIYQTKTETKVDTKVVEVEKELGWFDNILLRFGKIFFFGIIICVLIGGAYLWFKSKKKA